MKKHTKCFGVYHWDTFDNETMLIAEFDGFNETMDWIHKHYGTRLHPVGADRVDVVNQEGTVIRSMSVR